MSKKQSVRQNRRGAGPGLRPAATGPAKPRTVRLKNPDGTDLRTLPVPEALGQAMVLHQRGQIVEAEKIYRSILSVDRANFDALHLLGVTRHQQGDPQQATKLIKAAIRRFDGHAEAHNNLGGALNELGRHDEAVACYQRALKIRPDYAEAHNHLGIALSTLSRHTEAAACFRRAVKIRPNFGEAHNRLGIELGFLGRHEEAIDCYRLALNFRPNHADTYHSLGTALHFLKRHVEAIECFRRALSLMPDHRNAFSPMANSLTIVCDWAEHADIEIRMRNYVKDQSVNVHPLTFLSLCGEPADQLRCAAQYAAANVRLQPRLAPAAEGRSKDRIRIGYISGDYHDHPVAFLTAELFECHDRKKFEVFAYSVGPESQSDMRRRLVAAFDHFSDLRLMSDLEAAQRIAADEIDIAVDLGGYTNDARVGILACRPAPVQVNYLGFPATLGADFIDYIIVDPFVVPKSQDAFFTEKLVHLPDCLQANDSTRRVADRTPSRSECDLPEEGFVFCSFNSGYKITPTFFDIWMRLLHAVPESVLWLRPGNSIAEQNLRHEAEARGVDPGRLVFAPRVDELADHLARHRRADLFLDTLPYNAHATASDALWAGLPVLTCAGHSYAGRVAGSLLHAVGLPELVTDSLADYERLALTLATDPDLLADIRARLARNRSTKPLFDCDRFRCHIEDAYCTMWARWQRGEPAAPFAVTAR